LFFFRHVQSDPQSAELLLKDPAPFVTVFDFKSRDFRCQFILHRPSSARKRISLFAGQRELSATRVSTASAAVLKTERNHLYY
jgi:hypothetical protein